MASLLERMNIEQPAGANRNKKGKNDRSSPYSRPPKGDVDGKWEHDMHPLTSRLSAPDARAAAPKYNMSGALSAMTGTQSAGQSSLSIKGAGIPTLNNTLEIKGLVGGTTAEDVKAIFAQCGTITQAKLASGVRSEDPVVRLTYKRPEDAKAAATRFDGQNADGRTLSVKLVGSVASHLSARIGNAPAVVDGSVDAFLDDNAGGSKLRSDAILAADSRASVITTPQGQNPADYNTTRGGRGGGRGRGPRRRGGGGGRGNKKGGSGMDVDV